MSLGNVTISKSKETRDEFVTMAGPVGFREPLSSSISRKKYDLTVPGSDPVLLGILLQRFLARLLAHDPEQDGGLLLTINCDLAFKVGTKSGDAQVPIFSISKSPFDSAQDLNPEFRCSDESDQSVACQAAKVILTWYHQNKGQPIVSSRAEDG